MSAYKREMLRVPGFQAPASSLCQHVAPQTLRSAHDLPPDVGRGKWLPSTRTECSKEKSTENDPLLERGLSQTHWSLLSGRFRVHHKAMQKKTLLPKCGPGIMCIPGEESPAETPSAPFYGVLNCILAGDT